MPALQNMAIINNSSEKSSLIIEIGMARSRTRVQMQNARDQKNGRQQVPRRGKESFHYDLIGITVMKLRTSNKLLSNSNIYGVNDNDPFLLNEISAFMSWLLKIKLVNIPIYCTFRKLMVMKLIRPCNNQLFTR